MMTDLKQLVHHPDYPRAGKYDADWILDHQMGPNALWLMEWLTRDLDLQPGMRVLDLGCGKALTSVFLAREFGVQVWAVDLWMGPDGNWRRACEMGVGDRVVPMKGEAHALPFAGGFFDAALSVDAYQYFGTDSLYLDYLARLVRPGGKLGAAVVGLTRPIPAGPPAHLTEPQANGTPFWEPSCRSFETADSWRSRWQGSAMVDEVEVATMADGWRRWADFEQALDNSGKGRFPSVEEALRRDAGETIGFVKVTARRNDTGTMDFYDPSLGVRVGADA
jgi:ubiquinone/menaquinone biosynthesis C-methylase UbiE